MNMHQDMLVGNHSSSRVSAAENKTLPEPALPALLEAWQVLRRRKWRLILVLLIGVALAALYCLLSGPRYDSTTQLLVIKKRFETSPLTGPDQVHAPDDYLSTHMLLITSRLVVGRAIEKDKLQELAQFQDKGGLARDFSRWAWRTLLVSEPEMQPREKLTTDLINSLTVTRDAQRPGINPSNEVINLSFRSAVADDGPKVLNAIIASYQGLLQETYRNTNAEAVELISQARAIVQKDLGLKEAAYQRFLAETPPLWKSQDRSTAQQDRLIKIDAKLAALRIRRTEIEASIAMIEKAVKSSRNPTATVVRMLAQPGVDAAAANNVGITGRSRVSLEEELVDLQLQTAKLEAIHPKNHPEVVVSYRQLHALRNMLVSGVPNRHPKASENGLIDLAAIKVELLGQELDNLKISEQALTKLFGMEQKDVSASYLHETQDEAYRKGIERDRLLYDSILNRLKETSSARDFGGYTTQVIGTALPGTLAAKRYLLVFGLAGFIGIIMGSGWAYLAERSVRPTG